MATDGERSDDEHREVERYAREDRTMAALGIEPVGIGDGWAVTAMRVRRDLCDHRGVLARGHAFTLADAAIALASNSYGPVALLVHADVEWAADAELGATLTARCEVVQRVEGRATYLSTVTDEHGTVIGTVHGATRAPRR